MPDFRPFSMADALQSATSAAAGGMQIQSMRDARDDRNVFLGAARQAAQGDPNAAPPGVAPGMAPPAPPGMVPPGAPGMPAAPGAPPADQSQMVTPAQAQGQPNMPMGAADGSSNAKAVHQLFGVHTAGHKKSFSYDYFASLLEAQGRPDLAAGAHKMGQQKASAQMGIQLQMMDFIARAAPLITDQSALDALSQNMETIGMKGALPKQWSPQVQQQLMEIGGKSMQMLEYKLKAKDSDEKERHNRATEANAKRANELKEKEGLSTANKKYQELKATGVPDQIAKSVAYGGMRMIQDPMGLGAVFVDEITGSQIGELKNGKWSTTPGTFSGPGGGGRPPLDNFFTR